MKLVIGLLAASMWAGQANAQVSYGIDLSKPEHHTGMVSISFPAADGPYLDVKMPAWRTGRYQILNLANGVRQFSAKDATGKPLRWEKIDKSTWRIHLAGPSAVQVGYEVYGNELGLRSRHIDDSHAYLDASAVFMYADRYRKEPVTVSLNVPTAWKSYSGMDSPTPNRFSAANWDVLVDSPIETGISQVRSFSADSRDYQVVIWGRGNYDADQMAGDFKKIVQQAPTIWKGYPFKRYVFMIHATDGVGGATEHMNSTVIQMPRYMFRPREKYLSFLSTASHEFIHTWNVKAYRAAPMVPYDYQSENYTNLLWLEEGSTEYFTDQLLVRAGLMKTDEYLKSLADGIFANKNRPGRLVQSVAEASFDEWISQSGDRALNAQVNIYSEGAIASWALDIALLQQTDGRVSYRDVHQKLYERYSAEKGGFTDKDILAILKELTGTSWESWWAKHIDAPSDVDFNAVLSPVGLTYSISGGEGAKAVAGWSGKADENGVRLTTVNSGSAAWNAGFVPDDIIVAMDGQRIDTDRFAAVLGERKPGDVVDVAFFRRDQLQHKKLTLGSELAGKPTISPVDRPTTAQKALFQRWLLVRYPGKQ